MLQLEGDKEVKEGKGFKLLTPYKLLIGCQVLLAQIKAGNKSYKLKNKIRQHYIYCISIIISPKQIVTV